MIFDGFDHDGVLKVRPRNLHPAAGSDSRMRDIAITANLIRCVHDDDSFDQFGGKHTRALPKKRGFPHARPAQQKQALSGLDHIAKNVDGSKYRSAHAARQSNDDLAAVPDSRYAVQRAFDAGAVILRERADAVSHIVEIFAGDRRIG